jgi:hemerythrin-like metal-binding protein
MFRQLLDLRESGGTVLEVDVQEIDFPGDFWEFQKLAEHQNMQFADTSPHSFVETISPDQPRRAKYPVTPGNPTHGLHRKFRSTLTGLPAMDFEHEQLLLQLERVHGAKNLAVALADIEKFIKAWSLHHLHEKQHMLAKHYPEIEVHKAQHARLLDKYQFLRSEAMHCEAELESVKAYVEIVAKMIADHILRSDMLYVRWGNS